MSVIILKCAHAHSPHDVIKSVAVSPFYEKDHTVFTYVFAELKRSSDGGYSWKNLERGLDNNALISDVAASQRSVSEYDTFVATLGDGVYRSSDHGISWYSINAGLSDLNIRHLAVSPDYVNDHTLVAVPQGAGLFISSNAGDSWEQIAGDEFVATSVSIISIDGSRRLLVGTDKGEIYISGKALKHWLKQGEIAGAGMITSLSSLVTRKSKQLILVGTELDGLHETADLGKSFSHVKLYPDATNSHKSTHVTSVTAIERTESSTDVFITLWDESAFVSTNGGEDWILQDKGLKKNSQADEYNDPHFTEVVVPADYARHGEAFIAGFAGLFKTTDSAQTWSEMETRPARNIESLAVSPSFSRDHLLALASYDGGAYFSVDSGKTWKANNFGLKSTHLWHVAITDDARENLNIFMVNNNSLLALSGISESWSRNEIPVSPYWRFVLDNFDEGSFGMRLARRLLGRSEPLFATQIAVHPDYPVDKTIFLGTRYGGILKSTDAGSTWTNLCQECKAPVSSLKVSPDYEDDGVVAASVRFYGFYLSSDSGRSWEPRNNGLSSQAIQYQNLGTYVLEFSPAFAEDGRLYFGTADGLYFTQNNGQNWEQLNVTGKLQREHISAVGISPDFSDDSTMFASVKGHGLFKSTDKGRSFSEISPDLIHGNQLLKLIMFSPDYSIDHTIFAASSEEVFVSNDGGINWVMLERSTRYENTKDNFSYSQGWKHINNPASSALNIHASNIPGSKAEFYFVGEQVTWYGPASEKYGMANIYLDGVLTGKVDQYESETKRFVPIYTINGLSPGPHVLTIEVIDDKNKNASDYFIAIDALDVS